MTSKRYNAEETSKIRDYLIENKLLGQLYDETAPNNLNMKLVINEIEDYALAFIEETRRATGLLGSTVIGQFSNISLLEREAGII